MSVDRIESVAVLARSFAGKSDQIIYPEINLTCNGSILSWTFGAIWSGNTSAFTELQIWRSSGSGSYVKVGNTTIMTEENLMNVYQYPLSSPLAFQAGDVLGIYQPATSTSQLGLLYENVEFSQPSYFVIGPDIAPSQFTVSGSGVFEGDEYQVVVGVETGN